jgi:hypothetical protein
MMKLITLILFLCLPIVALANGSILLPIPQEKIEYGCGCSYRMNESAPFKFVFQSETNYENPTAYISGQLVQLEPIKVETIPKIPKVGDTFTQQYRYKDIDLMFFNTITFVCPKGSEGGCEVTGFKTKLKIIRKGEVEIIQLFGDCGC